MSGYCKYYKQKKQVSYDNGLTWTDTGDYQKGDLYETFSTDCGYIGVITRWINSGTTCSGYDKYYLQVKQESYDGGSTWITVTPVETRQGTLIERNSEDCGYTPTPATSGDYFSTTALEDGYIFFKSTSYDNYAYFSKDNGLTWNNKEVENADIDIGGIGETSSVIVTAGQTILWKSTIPVQQLRGIGFFKSSYGCRFSVQGNIMSLLYGDNFIGQTNLSGKEWAFNYLFRYSYYLTNAENLILPATTLSDYCYNQMFWECKLLTNAPRVLPALTLKSNCYWGMFAGCKSLTTAPSLPATTLAEDCYCNMFNGCTSLTTAPQLPATTLADDCYSGMFINCKNLTTAPTLPATTLAIRCYNDMFNGCNILNSITCLATDISAEACTGGWLNYVSPSGTFVKASDMNDWTTGTSGIPSGWTIQNA